MNIDKIMSQILDESQRFKAVIHCIEENIQTKEEYRRLVTLLNNTLEKEEKRLLPANGTLEK